MMLRRSVLRLIGVLPASLLAQAVHDDIDGTVTLESGTKKPLHQMWSAGPHRFRGLEYSTSPESYREPPREDENPFFSLETVKAIEFVAPTEAEMKFIKKSDLDGFPALDPRKATVYLKNGKKMENIFFARLWVATSDGLQFYCGSTRIVRIDITSAFKP